MKATFLLDAGSDVYEWSTTIRVPTVYHAGAVVCDLHNLTVAGLVLSEIRNLCEWMYRGAAGRPVKKVLRVEIVDERGVRTWFTTKPND